MPRRKLARPRGKSVWTVLNDDRRESLLGKTVRPEQEMLRVGNLAGPWHIELKIPQRNIDFVNRRKGAVSLTGYRHDRKLVGFLVELVVQGQGFAGFDLYLNLTHFVPNTAQREGIRSRRNCLQLKTAIGLGDYSQTRGLQTKGNAKNYIRVSTTL